MTHKPTRLRIAAGALFASVVLPATPGLAQDVPVATPSAPVATTPPPVATTPPVTVAPTPTPAPQPRPPVQLAPRPPVSEESATPTPAGETQPTRRRTTQRAERPAPRPRAEASAPRAAAPAPEPVSEPAPAPAPAVPPEAAAPAPLPPAATPEPAPVEPAAPAETASAAPIWPWFAAGAALLLGLFAFFASRRSRAEEAYDEEPVYAAPTYEAPAASAPPVAAAPAVAVAPVLAAAQPARIEETEISAANDSDVEALNAGSAPVADRPWLEFLMRPVRAGTDGDEARVEFELTVGNTGSVPARDVRISTWMVAASETTEMERALIEPPVDAQRTEVDIPAGDGAKVEAAISVPTEGLRGKVLPVIVADARYRLPDGSEGRTSASFAVGLPNGEGLEPFAVDLPSGLHDDVEARLHSEPQRV